MSNQVTHKLVQFDITEEKKSAQPDLNSTDVGVMIEDLEKKLSLAKNLQEAHLHSMKGHHELNNHTNNTVAALALFQDFCCLSVVVMQVFFLKRFFDYRRSV